MDGISEKENKAWGAGGKGEYSRRGRKGGRSKFIS